MFSHSVLVCLLAVTVGLAGNSLAGQYPGDVYFTQPSVTAASGAEVELTVETYVGSQPFGAVHFAVEFDSAALEVVATDPGPDPWLQNNLRSHATTGAVAVLTHNAASLVQPIGSVGLAKVRFRVLASPGATILVGLRVIGLLDASSAPVTARGLTGTITVISPSAAPPGARPPVQEPVDFGALPLVWQKRALAMRRPGSEVELSLPVWDGRSYTAVPVKVALPPSPGDGDRVQAKAR